jgi:hypothetical protein
VTADSTPPATDPVRQAGFQSVWILYASASGRIRARSDDIRTEDFARLWALLDELRI